MQKLLTTVAALTVAALTIPAVAGAAGPRQIYRDTFSTSTPNATAGRHFHVDFVNPDDPDAKPAPLRHVALRLHPGTRFDTGAVPRCTASDAELIALGASACPAGSGVGHDDVLVDTGVPGPQRFTEADTLFFNAEDELILLNTVRGTEARVVLRAQMRENGYDIEVPLLPGTPPDGGANKREHAFIKPRSSVVDGRRRAYLTTPPSCPSSGQWTNRVTYTYADGVIQTAKAKSPCVRPAASTPDRRRPRIRVGGVPEGCTSSGFVARIRVLDESALRRARVRLDGRRLTTRRRKRFRVRVRARGLASGVHRLRVSAIDSAGNPARRTFRFRRCGRAGPARFPG